MKINRIEINNFRSIKKIDTKLADFNTFVGPNNHGKTNLLEALDWFYSGKTTLADKFNHQKDLDIIVRLTFFGARESLELMEEGRQKTLLSNILDGEDEFVIEKTSIDDKRSIFVNGENKGNPSGFDAALNYFLPKLEYITTKNRLTDVSKYKAKSPIAEMLSGVLSGVLAEDPKYKEFLSLFDELFNGENSLFRSSLDRLQQKVEMYLEKQFPEGTSVRFQIDDPEVDDLLKKFETEVDDGVKTKAEQKGDGMQRALMLAIIQAYADFRKENQIAKNFLFLIDEAELHLHPSAQRALKYALIDILEKGDQVLISTHSSVFVVENINEEHKIFEIFKEDGFTGSKELKDENHRLDIVYNLLGGSPADLLLPRNFIIVEGQSEAKFLEKIISRFYKNDFIGVKIIFARGDVDMEKEIYHSIHRAYTPLHTNGVYKNTAIIICDKPKNIVKFGAFKTAHPWLIEGEQLHILPVDSLEKYYPSPYKKSDEEIARMGREREKVAYSIEVAENITQDQFEDEMSVLREALNKCTEKAHK